VVVKKEENVYRVSIVCPFLAEVKLWYTSGVYVNLIHSDED